MFPTKILIVDINAPFAKVVTELGTPLNHPSWATEFFEGAAEPLSDTEVRVNVPRMGGRVPDEG